jgi:hypothetical protein
MGFILTPHSKRNALGPLYTDPSGKTYVRAFVTTVPEDSKANQALIKLVAKAMKLSKSSVMIVSGHAGRRKMLEIQGTQIDLVKIKKFIFPILKRF